MNKQDEEKAREIENAMRNCKQLISPSWDYFEGLYQGALEMAAWKEHQMIEKAVEWLFSNHTHYPNNGIGTEQIIKDFKKAMMEE